MKDNLNPLNLFQRMNQKTPPFWRKMRNLCIAAGVAGGAILSAPIALPVLVVSVAPYLVTAGIVGTFLSQLTKQDHTDTR